MGPVLQVEGRAHFAKAAMACPWLKYPLTNLGGTVRMAENALKASHPYHTSNVFADK
jgi:hypothetical protein